MNNLEILKDYYSEKVNFVTPWGNRISTLIAAIRDARLMTSRIDKTGEFNFEAKFGDIGSWLGAMGYMSALDQIGSSISLKNKDKLMERSPILKAITFFYSNILTEDEIHALIALRNAFLHNFNLINVTTPKHLFAKEQTHRFIVTAEFDDWIVKLPTERWNGDYQNKDWHNSTATWINLYQFGNMVESILNNIRIKLKNDEVEINEKDILSFLNKYTFVILESVE